MCPAASAASTPSASLTITCLLLRVLPRASSGCTATRVEGGASGASVWSAAGAAGGSCLPRVPTRVRHTEQHSMHLSHVLTGRRPNSPAALQEPACTSRAAWRRPSMASARLRACLKMHNCCFGGQSGGGTTVNAGAQHATAAARKLKVSAHISHALDPSALRKPQPAVSLTIRPLRECSARVRHLATH